MHVSTLGRLPAFVVFLLLQLLLPQLVVAEDLVRLKFNHPGLEVDLGVGLWAWPLPMDYDGDGDPDLVVSCPDVPYRGLYFFENPGGSTNPIFKPAVRIATGLTNLRVSYVDGQPRVLAPGKEYRNFRKRQLADEQPLATADNFHLRHAKIRANQWSYVDYDGDGRTDLIMGIEDWSEYGWDNAFDARGNWTRGPLHGHVYWARNETDDQRPRYAEPVKLNADGKPIDVYGMPSPCFADFDRDGDLDLICGEFLDGFTLFLNSGTRTEPVYDAPVRLQSSGRPLVMDLQMITPTAFDWDADGDADLIVGDEDGRVAWLENVTTLSGDIQFRSPVYFRQQADWLKCGALVTPSACDWDGDGDEDLICGNTAGYLELLENLDGQDPPRWAAPRRLTAGGQVIRLQAGPNGSIQGPCEAKWGYTAPCVVDWNHDGRLDILVNSIWGRVIWYQNIGQAGAPELQGPMDLQVNWPDAPQKPAWNWWDPEDGQLVTQWRTSPTAIDWDEDGHCDLVMLDSEGYLALWKRLADGSLAPPARVFGGPADTQYSANHSTIRSEASRDPAPLRLNAGQAGASGRRKFAIVDWDGDGLLDLIVNSRSVNLLRQNGLQQVPESQQPLIVFDDRGALSETQLAGHTTSPTTVDWNGDGVGDLLIGAEDGHFYYLRRK